MEELTIKKAEAHDLSMEMAEMQKQFKAKAEWYNALVAEIEKLKQEK